MLGGMDSVLPPENVVPAQKAGLSLTLSAVAARVLGALIEKEFATPDSYPLTLNALVNACNQRSNRDPVMALAEADVSAALDELRVLKLAVLFVGADSRVPKYKHKLDDVFPMEDVARAAMCELLVRGPQTAASLRGNSERLHRMPPLPEFEALLETLGGRVSGALVKKLPRQLGKKEARWTHLLSGEVDVQAEPEAVFRPAPSDLERRVTELEATVQKLREELDALRSAWT